MSNWKSTFAAALLCGAGLAMVAATPTTVSATPLTPALALKNAAKDTGTVETVRYWGHRGWGWGGPFVAGAIIGGALAAPYYYGPRYYYPAPAYDAPYPPGAYGPPPGGDDAIAYCQQRFRSYDPGTGTYLGFDGARHPCP